MSKQTTIFTPEGSLSTWASEQHVAILSLLLVSVSNVLVSSEPPQGPLCHLPATCFPQGGLHHSPVPALRSQAEDA